MFSWLRGKAMKRSLSDVQSYLASDYKNSALVDVELNSIARELNLTFEQLIMLPNSVESRAMGADFTRLARNAQKNGNDAVWAAATILSITQTSKAGNTEDEVVTGSFAADLLRASAVRYARFCNSVKPQDTHEVDQCRVWAEIVGRVWEEKSWDELFDVLDSVVTRLNDRREDAAEAQIGMAAQVKVSLEGLPPIEQWPEGLYARNISLALSYARLPDVTLAHRSGAILAAIYFAARFATTTGSVSSSVLEAYSQTLSILENIQKAILKRAEPH